MSWTGVCRHCGDHTEAGDDPAPDLCAMCEKAGRASVLLAAEAVSQALTGTPPNRYGELHRAVESAGNQASGRGLYEEATTLWAIAARIKEKGRPSRG